MEKENADLKRRLEDSNALNDDNESLLKDLKTGLNSVTSENGIFARRIQYLTQKMEDNQKLELKLEEISRKLQDE